MTEDRTDSPGNRFAHMKVDHLHGLAERIAKGEYIDGPELAERLRGHGSRPIPDTLLDYLCRYLEGSIEKPKGRKPFPETEQRLREMFVRGLYYSWLEQLMDRKRRYGHPAGWTKLEYTPAELAARLVARKRPFHGEGSWRSVQNLASSINKK